MQGHKKSTQKKTESTFIREKKRCSADRHRALCHICSLLISLPPVSTAFVALTAPLIRNADRTALYRSCQGSGL